MVRAADEVQLTRTHFPSSPIPDTEETAAARQDEQERKNAFEQRLKEIVGEQRWVEQQVEEQLRAQAERARENQSGEERARAKLTEMAASIGVTADDAMRFMDRLQELGPVLGPKFEEFEKSLTGTPEEKRKQMQAVIRAEMEKVATEIVGDKGRALVEKLTQEERF